MKLLRDLVRVLLGYLGYRRTGRTSHRAYVAMRSLHTRTDGRFNDLWRALAHWTDPWQPQASQGFLGTWSIAELQALAGTLERDGIAVLDRRAPEALCRALEDYARTTPSQPMGLAAPELYAAATARALRYDFDMGALLTHPLTGPIARDESLAAMAGAYFRSVPVFDFVTMWWTTPKGARDHAGAAQQFHYDMDRPFFVKIFVYVTDVGDDNGPHVYVAGSHRRKPRPLRADRRFEDAEVLAHYPRERLRRIVGPRGTVFIADTRGIHKGEPVREGERLVLQVEYALNQFGQHY